MLSTDQNASTVRDDEPADEGKGLSRSQAIFKLFMDAVADRDAGSWTI